MMITKQPPVVEDLRNHSQEQIDELRQLLAVDAPSRPDPRRPGFYEVAGLANTYFWVDPSKHVAGVILTQILPFADPSVLGLYAKFESGVYKALA